MTTTDDMMALYEAQEAEDNAVLAAVMMQRGEYDSRIMDAPGVMQRLQKEETMGITTWTASGILNSGRGGGRNPYPSNEPITIGDIFSLLLFLFAFLVAPIAAIIVIAVATLNAPPTTDCCTLACRTEHHLPQCK